MNAWVLFDWGGTLMRDFPGSKGKMKDWRRVEAVPGARKALHQIHGQVGVALATRAEESDEADIREALARVELDAFIKRIYSPLALGLDKGSPDFYRRILAELKVSPDRVVMVGDNYKEDVEAARAAGMRAVWFNEHNSEERTGAHMATLHHLDHLQGLLTAWGILKRS
ncbi:HAD family hydrolase [Holophaga foetida]|uniref:HAD family hydrolase n=1 Tax=Holophaga foetida TaxID=35839 RepID=UPI0002473765|nr:HAD family hydrolase [Holophaga foetida]